MSSMFSSALECDLRGIHTAIEDLAPPVTVSTEAAWSSLQQQGTKSHHIPSSTQDSCHSHSKVETSDSTSTCHRSMNPPSSKASYGSKAATQSLTNSSNNETSNSCRARNGSSFQTCPPSSTSSHSQHKFSWITNTTSQLERYMADDSDYKSCAIPEYEKVHQEARARHELELRQLVAKDY